MRSFKFDLRKLKIGNGKRLLTIEGVNFELNEDKNCVALLGQSGIGKTTIFKSLFSNYLKMWKTEGNFELTCHHEMDSQEITLEALLTNKVDLKFGFATQVPFFFNDRTVGENLFLPLKWKKITWSDEQRIEYIERFRLGDLVDAQMSELSGGQRQLLNIARMLILKPRLAIIDECFSNMDERRSKETITLIKKHYPTIRFLFTSHRKSDIEFFEAQEHTLVREQSKSGEPYITLS